MSLKYVVQAGILSAIAGAASVPLTFAMLATAPLQGAHAEATCMKDHPTQVKCNASEAPGDPAIRDPATASALPGYEYLPYPTLRQHSGEVEIFSPYLDTPRRFML